VGKGLEGLTEKAREREREGVCCKFGRAREFFFQEESMS